MSRSEICWIDFKKLMEPLKNNEYQSGQNCEYKIV